MNDRNEQTIRAFAESKGYKIEGDLQILTDRSDMATGSFLWYQDGTGTLFLVLPKYNRVAHMLNSSTGLNIRN